MQPPMQPVKHFMTLAVVAVLSVAFFVSCASSLSGSAYPRSQARGVQQVQMGVVEHVREVLIEGTRTGVGKVAGGIIGGVAGSEIGSGKGSVIGSVAGAVAGGLAGSAAEQAVTRQKGLEITVKLDSGRLIAVTQAADERFTVGDRVRVLTGQGITRVTR